MRETIRPGGSFRLMKRQGGNREVHQQARMTGIWERTRVDKATGMILGIDRALNTIQTAGKTEFLNLVTGASAAHFDQNVYLKIYNGTPGTEVKSFTASDAAPNHTTPDEVFWEFSDISVNTYTATRVEFGKGAVLFSDSTPNFGAKPNTENWIYKYRLQITTSDVNLDYAGLDEMLQLFTGTSIQHFDANATSLRVYSAQTPTVLGTYTGAQDATYPSVSGNQVSMRWTVPAGTLTGNWEHVEIYGEYGPDVILRSYGSPPVWDTLGAKGSNEEWQYTYTLTI